MKLKIGLNPTDIQKAIDFIKPKTNVMLDTIVQTFIRLSLDEIKIIAYRNLFDIDVSANLILDIDREWKITQQKVGSEYIGQLINTHDKAVYLEFGVGRKGQQLPHANANKAGYEYDIPTSAKSVNGYWLFSPDDERLIDIAPQYYNIVGKTDKFVLTQGQPATHYLYNAMIEYMTSGLHKQVWARATKFFFGV